MAKKTKSAPKWKSSYKKGDMFGPGPNDYVGAPANSASPPKPGKTGGHTKPPPGGRGGQIKPHQGGGHIGGLPRGNPPGHDPGGRGNPHPGGPPRPHPTPGVSPNPGPGWKPKPGGNPSPIPQADGGWRTHPPVSGGSPIKQADGGFRTRPKGTGTGSGGDWQGMVSNLHHGGPSARVTGTKSSKPTKVKQPGYSG